MSRWEFPAADPSELVQRIQDLESRGDERIRNQHVVSKVILRGFASPGTRGKGWLLTPFDLHYEHEQRTRGLDGCGKIVDFLPFASASAELIWKGVEDRLHPAILAARAGHLHNQPGHVEAIIDSIALHLVRSLRYRDIDRASTARAIDNVRQVAMHARKATLEAEFQRRYGIAPAGPEALAMILEDPISKWRALGDKGTIVRASMEEMFRRVSSGLRSLDVEIWHTPPGYELLISDSPAFTFRHSEMGEIVETNVAIGDATGIALPLAGDCLAAISPAAKNDTLTPEQVSLFNGLQVQVAHRHVYYRPGNRGAKTFVEAILQLKKGLVGPSIRPIVLLRSPPELAASVPRHQGSRSYFRCIANFHMLPVAALW
jgi:hypothetical protein